MIHFFNEDVDFNHLPLAAVPSWLSHVAVHESSSVLELNYIFCSDDYLLQINRQYLNHDFYTDIITFDNSEEAGVIEGDIFISLDRVNDNFSAHQTTYHSELLRVIIHGLLHLLGYDDRDEKSKATMRKMEDKYLDLYFRLFHRDES